MHLLQINKYTGFVNSFIWNNISVFRVKTANFWSISDELHKEWQVKQFD